MAKIVARGKKFEPTGEILDNGFPGIYREYEFHPWEIDWLLEGLEIKILTEEDKIAIGRLEKDIIDGNYIWQFKETVPYQTWGHIWQDDEREKLLKGETLCIKNFYNPKKIRNFSAKVSFDMIKRELILDLDDKDEFDISKKL